MTREEKVAEMVTIREKLVALYSEIKVDEETLKLKQSEYKTMKSKYESIDMELALEDQRFEKAKGPSTSKHAVKVESLTIDQILGIAAELGVSL